MTRVLGRCGGRGLAVAVLGAAGFCPPAGGQCETDKLLASDGSGGDFFGTAVGVSGDTAIVGGFFANAAYVYRFGGSAWHQEAILVPAAPGPFDLFGKSVAIRGDVAVVGANGDDDNTGSAYVFRYQPVSSTWVREAKLLASDGEADDRFGWSVAVSGETVVVGALTNDMGTNSGAAYVFGLDGSSWVEEAKLLASDAAEGDHFGWSVAIDAQVIVAGASADDDNGVSSGSAYVFRFDGARWVEEAKLVDADGAAGDLLGRSVAVSGDTAVVGAPGDHPGAALVFRGCLGWAQEARLEPSAGKETQSFGNAVSIDGDVILVGATGDSENAVLAGAAHVFRLDGTAWVEQAKLLASDGAVFDSFGKSVAVAGDVAVVGADKDDDNGADSGSAYVFAGLSGADCNGNGVADACDLDAGTSRDADGNQVPDECDCPWDLDGSGVVGVVDLLSLLAAWGGSPGGPPDFDGDGTVGIRDLLALLAHWGPCPLYADCNGNGVADFLDLETGASADCNANGVPDECDVAAGTASDCNGNGVPDACDVLSCASVDCNRNSVPDECDVAGGGSGDSDGNGVPDECDFTADDCADAVAVTDGDTPFFTTGATTDGPLVDCGDGVIEMLNDVWFLYTASCTGTVTLSLCNAVDFDAALAIYVAGECPAPTQVSPLACSDDAPGCGQTPLVQLFAAEGTSYFVRVGSPGGQEGAGVLTVSCEPLP